MIENADFVNMYIDKLNKTIHDLTGRNIVCETRLDVSQKYIKQLEDQLSSFTAQMEELVAQHKKELDAKSKQIDHIRHENSQLKDVIKQLEAASLVEQPDEVDEQIIEDAKEDASGGTF